MGGDGEGSSFTNASRHLILFSITTHTEICGNLVPCATLLCSIIFKKKEFVLKVHQSPFETVIAVISGCVDKYIIYIFHICIDI